MTTEVSPPPIRILDGNEANLWVQWQSVYMAQHKMLPEAAAKCADEALRLWRDRQPAIYPAGKA